MDKGFDIWMHNIVINTLYNKYESLVDKEYADILRTADFDTRQKLIEELNHRQKNRYDNIGQAYMCYQRAVEMRDNTSTEIIQKLNQLRHERDFLDGPPADLIQNLQSELSDFQGE